MTSSASGLDSSQTAAGPDQPSHGMQARTTASAALGSALEYFDFTIYGALSATIFPKLFFGNLSDTAALLLSFATFGAGFFARPLGALVFGHLGDRMGRKPLLFITLTLMGISSVLIGCLPTGQGAVVAAILVFLRFLQGFALGGEIGGSQVMTMEHSEIHRRGLMGSFITMGSPISQVLGNLTLLTLSSVLSTESYESWGWRIPFLGSLLIIAVAVLIRLKLEETPAFVSAQQAESAEEQRRHQGLKVFVTHPGTVIRLVLMWGGGSFSFFLIAVYGLSYVRAAGVPTNLAFLLLMIANAVAVVTCMVSGWISDRIGRKPVMAAGLIGVFITNILFFTFGGTNLLVTGIIMALALGSNLSINGPQPAMFSEQFPTEVRFSGVALSHGLANLAFAAPSAFVAAWLASFGGSKLVMGLSLVLVAISITSLATLKDRRDIDLTTFNEAGAPRASVAPQAA